MLRIRFHGRGGQGMKTASRILGSAAFHAGLVVQDSPIYGAERRGAPMSAMTRIAREPIRERGMIARPDLAVIADDTLLTDPTALPLAGCDALSTVLLNSTKTEEELRQSGVPLVGRLLIADFTTMVLTATQSLASLSVALGVAAVGLCDLALDAALAGVEAELSSTLTAEQRASNVALAKTAYENLTQSRGDAGGLSGLLRASASPREIPPAAVLVEVGFDPPRMAAPSIYALANSSERHTGNWRQFRPVLHQALCTKCWICFVRCPEGAITLDANEYPVVNYDECKGCLLCVHDCPTHAFTTEKESR
ncbi:MAG: 4Fe-4S binding protein [Deltaproteobacteria bacterium]|nr:4Fe-4S binding protein [Deltaproteobacteria bacterium]